MKTIIIKTDASATIGFGHLRRCMTLAKELFKQECAVYFLINNDQAAVNFLKQESFKYTVVSEADNENFVDTRKKIEQLSADVLVIDSYRVTLEGLHEISIPKVYMDDLGITDCVFDLVVNPSLLVKKDEIKDPRFLYGPRYALLREDFSNNNSKKISDKIEKVLLTLGGSDPKNHTLKLLQYLYGESPELELVVVLGPFFTEEVKKQIIDYSLSKENIVIEDSPGNLPLLMYQADLIVSAGGQTTYELSALGIPAIIFSVVANQTSNIEMFSKSGAICFIGSTEQENIKQVFSTALTDLLHDKNKRKAMSDAGKQLVDGLGAQRVAFEICSLKCVETKGV